LLLLNHVHAIEKLGGLLGIAKLGNTIQRHHRSRKLLLRAVHQQHRAVGKIDLLVANDTFGQPGEFLEVLHNGLPFPLTANWKPYFPPEDSSKVSGQQLGGISPQGTDLCRPDGFDGIQ